MARHTSTLDKISDAATDSLERAGIDRQRAAELIAATRAQTLALGHDAIERAEERREQIEEAVRSAIEQLPAVSIEVSRKKPGLLGDRSTNVALMLGGLILLALVGFAVAARKREWQAESSA